jgi:hypothetical protein
MPGSHAPPPPLHRDHRPPLPPATATPEPPFEVENLGRKSAPDRQQRLRRQQRDMVAGTSVEVRLEDAPDPWRTSSIEGPEPTFDRERLGGSEGAACTDTAARATNPASVAIIVRISASIEDRFPELCATTIDTT